MRFLLLCFIVIPVVEMWLLIKVGSFIGAGSTVLLVLLTAVIGSMLLRSQGLSTLLRARQRMESSQLPANEMIEGLVLAVSGALLLTPGFITDVVGFVGLLPFTRIPLVKWLVSKFSIASFATMGQGADGETVYRRAGAHYRSGHHSGHNSGHGHSGSASHNETVVDAEFWEQSDGEDQHRIK